MKSPTKSLIAIGAAFLFAASAFAATDEQATAIFQKLLDAQASKNYDAFVADGTDALKAALTKTQFEAASDFLSKRFKDGYETKFLGELKRHDSQVFLYKLQCKDGGDDLLATLALKDDKVAGIFFK